jgi:hypothetical protein
MLRIKKHIILVGNSTGRLITLQQRIREIAPETTSYISDICSIREVLCSQPADMILVHTRDTACFPFVQRIRQERLADRIPVFVCREPLEEVVLKELLNGGYKY